MFARADILVPLVYLLAAIPYALLGLYAWHKRPAVAVTPFAWTMLGMSVWSFGYALEVFFPDLQTKIFCVQFEYFGIAAAPLFMLFFAFEYTGNSHLLTRRTRFILWIIPILSLIVVWTNPFHNLMWDNETTITAGGLTLLSIRFGLFFWIHTLFSYGVLLAASAMLVMELIYRPGIYRAQISFIILAILFPLMGSLVFISGVGPIRNLDLTPLFFLPTALGLFWAIIKYRLLEILPPEHINVIKNMKDGVIILNFQQRILYLNSTAEALLQREDAKAIGQPLSQISEAFYEKLSPYLADGERRAEIRLTSGGQMKVFEATVSPVPAMKSVQGQKRADCMVILHDVTQSKEAELALARRESIMSAISHAAEQFLRTPAWEGNIPEVLGKLGQAAGVSRVFVAVNYTDENKVVHSSLCYEWAAPGIAPQINNPALRHIPLKAKGLGRWQKTMSDGNAIHSLVKELPEEERIFFKPLESLSFAAIPIFVESRWWGFLLFDECREERKWTGMELDAFHAAASIFGAAESRARTEQQVLHRQRTLSLLHEIVGISLQADDIKEMTRVVVERLGGLIQADGCFITLWDDTAKLPIPLASYGMSADVYAAFKPRQGDLTFTESALRYGRTLVVEDTSATPYADKSIIQMFAAKSVLVLPLIASEKKMGAVILAFGKRHRFQKEEIVICEQASALIALALEKFQAVEEARRRATASETLRKAGLVIVEKLEMDQAVNHILEQLRRVVQYDSASVQLLEENELVIIGGRGWENPDDVLGMRFSIPGDNPNSEVIQTGKLLRLSDAGKIYQKFNEPPHNHIRAWLGVPLIAQEKVIGLLAIDSSKPGNFTEEDANLASIFADQVAVALENARLFSETKEQAVIDPLTEIYNRRGLLQFGMIEFQRSMEGNRKFSAIMADIDHFKKINDTHGHDAGDKVLRQFALQCKKCVRDIDLVGRYGGEEIVILLPNTDLTASLRVAKRLGSAIAAMFVNILEGVDINITASLGVACTDENTTSLDILINRADQAMYSAKRNGRNRVEYSV